jgi:hypothetical protein
VHDGAALAVMQADDRDLGAVQLGWDLWAVRYATMRQTAWCARPKGAPVATINVDSPEALIAEISEQETEL